MNLYHLEYIAEVAKTLNITEAAKNLNISQPTLSIYMKKLENDLGLSLFQRSNNTLIITEAGKKYADACAQILEIRDHLYKELFGSNTAHIRLGTLSSSFSVFTNVLCRFKQLYPQTMLQPAIFSSEGVYKELVIGSIDIGFVTSYSHDFSNLYKNTRYIIAQEYEMMVLIHKKNSVYKKLNLENGELSNSDYKKLEKLTLFSGTNNMVKSWYHEYLLPKLQIIPAKELAINDVSFASRSLALEDSFMILPYSRIDSNELAQIPFSFHPKIYKLFIYLKNHVLSEPENILIKIALEEFQQDPYYYHIPPTSFQ